VASRKLASGTGLQIALELERGSLVIELDDDERSPWPVVGRVRRQAGIVRCQAGPNVGCKADVVLARNRKALEDVNEPLRR
jgi:hypothetical protein